MIQNGNSNQIKRDKSKKMNFKKSKISLMASKKCKKKREKMEFSKMKEENYKLIILRKKKSLL